MQRPLLESFTKGFPGFVCLSLDSLPPVNRFPDRLEQCSLLTTDCRSVDNSTLAGPPVDSCARCMRGYCGITHRPAQDLPSLPPSDSRVGGQGACGRACEGAGGSIFKFGPQIKRMRSPWSEPSIVGELRRPVAVYRVQRSMPCLRTAGNQRAEFSSSHPCRSPRTSTRSFLRVGPGQGGRKRLTSDFRDVPSRNIAREATVFIWG